MRNGGHFFRNGESPPFKQQGCRHLLFYSAFRELQSFNFITHFLHDGHRTVMEGMNYKIKGHSHCH